LSTGLINLLPFDVEIQIDQKTTDRVVIKCTSLLREIVGKRHVYEGTWNGQAVIVKVFDSFRGRLNSSREFHGFTVLQKRGISSPRVLLKGQDHHGGAVLVLEKIPDGQDLTVFFKDCRDEQEKKEMYSRWINFAAAMNEKGIRQNDFHAGNFLLAKSGLFALDAAQMKFSARPLRQTASFIQLAMLYCSIPKQDLPDRKWVIETYCDARGWATSVKIQSQFDQLITKAKARANRRFLKKIMRSSRYTFFMRENGYSGIFLRDRWSEDGAREFIQKIDRLMESGQILKQGTTCFVSRVKVGALNIVIKRYNHKGWIHSLRQTLKGSRAKRNWQNGHRLQQYQIPTAAPAAYLELKKGPLVCQSYFVADFVDGPNLNEYLRSAVVTQADRRKTIGHIEQLLAALKNNRMSHGDLKLTNILIHNNRPVLIDLDSVRKHACRWSLLFYAHKMTASFQSHIKEYNT